MVDPILAHAGLDHLVTLHIAEGSGKDPVVIEGEITGLTLAGDIDASTLPDGFTKCIGKSLLTGSRRISGSPPLGSDWRGAGGGEGEGYRRYEGEESQRGKGAEVGVHGVGFIEGAEDKDNFCVIIRKP